MYCTLSLWWCCCSFFSSLPLPVPHTSYYAYTIVLFLCYILEQSVFLWVVAYSFCGLHNIFVYTTGTIFLNDAAAHIVANIGSPLYIYCWLTGTCLLAIWTLAIASSKALIERPVSYTYGKPSLRIRILRSLSRVYMEGPTAVLLSCVNTGTAISLRLCCWLIGMLV